MENREEQFLKISYDILKNEELNAGEKITLALIYSFHNNKKQMYMSYTKMALTMGVSRTTAVDRINSLRNMGYIETVDITKQKRIIIPLRMVEIPTKMVDLPTKVVDRPTTIVDVPTSDSRNTDQEVVDVLGAIIYPILDETLEKPLNSVLDTQLNNENSTEHRTVAKIQLERYSKLKEQIKFNFSEYFKDEHQQHNFLFKWIEQSSYKNIENRIKRDLTPEEIKLFETYVNSKP